MRNLFLALIVKIVDNQSMGIANLFKGFSKKGKMEGESGLLEQINFSMDLLVQKSRNLNSQFEAEKQQIADIANTARTIRESGVIFSAKLEQDILGKITAVSSVCDAVLAGRPVNTMQQSIEALKAAISQRLALSSK